MRLQILLHVPYEGPGIIADWAAAAGHALGSTRLHDGEPLPPVGTVDGVIVMGGTMSVHDEALHPWLVAEKRWIEGAIRAGKPVLGICLGAQLVATALGAPVRRAPLAEIGWFPVFRAAEAIPSPFAPLVPDRIEAFHWHGDAFELPAGAVRLARSEACENQAFALGDRVLALQFHPEMTRHGAAELIRHSGDQIVAGPYVQGATEILEEDRPFAPANGFLRRLLGRLLR